MAILREHAAQVASEKEAKQRKLAEANRIEAENARRDSESRMARLYLDRWSPSYRFQSNILDFLGLCKQCESNPNPRLQPRSLTAYPINDQELPNC